MRELQALSLLASIVLVTGCSGSAGSAGPAAAFETTTVEAGDECPAGGERIELGVDSNRNGTLEASEITKSYVTCNGSSSSGAGAALVVSVKEPAGKNCAQGGVAVSSGVDADGDGALTGKEIKHTDYVCAGSDGSAGVDGSNGKDGEQGPVGEDGTNGKDGKDGQSSLISTVVEPPGAHCAAGGVLITGGPDLNANGVLEASEVTATAYVCNGGTSLLRTTFESPGSNCLHGGFRIDSGLDSDFNGTLSDAEIKTSNFVCNGANGLNGGIDGLSSLVRTVTEAPGSHCSSGGVRIEMGIDDNQNTVLDASEVDSVSYVCTGANGSNGVDGALSLVRTTAEAIGLHCPTGGVKVDTGVDDNHNTLLETSEIDATTYVCNGIAGLNGSNGINGLSNLVNTTIELPGVNCSAGGLKLTSGVDANSSGVLDSGEVNNSSFICNGLNGLNGLASLTKTAIELPGTNCASGGFKLSTGIDSNGNGVLDAAEATANNYLCNGLNGIAGVNGLSGLVSTAIELPGTHCTAGGFKVNTGNDVNANLVLDVGEITATNYLCNGINGLAGIAGTNGSNGTNGLNSLLKSTLELPGANCTLGGFKLDTGSDTNKNGLLDAAEVTATNYVCNGATGSTGSTGLSSVMKTSLELPGTHCLLGGLKIDTGIDTNKNGLLDSGEVTNTTYQCTLQ